MVVSAFFIAVVTPKDCGGQMPRFASDVAEMAADVYAAT